MAQAWFNQEINTHVMKINYPFSLFLFVVLMVFSNCKKESDETVTVEYQITPMNVYFTKITYKDQTGNDVVINDYSQFASGTKSISVTAPFNARLETIATSTTSSTVYYSLSIKVNGEVKQVTSVSLPSMATTTSSVQYSVP
jgi:hypothetical protein